MSHETQMNILLVEDDLFLQEGLEMLFVKEGFQLRAARSVQEARSKLSDDTSLLILDVGLPDGNGFAFCREVRALHEHLPILFLTAREEEYDVVRGFECGGNDYVVKPFRALELIARVRALLKRFTEKNVSDGGTVVLNQARFQATVYDRVVQLTPTEFSLLNKLIANRGQILTRDQLLSSLWDMDGQFTDDNTLSVHIYRLREKIGHEAIETVRGAGYCWRGLNA